MAGTLLTHFFGSGNTTPGVAYPPALLRTDPLDVGDDTTGIEITFNASAPSDQAAIRLVDRDGTTVIAEVRQDGVYIWNRKVGATHSVFVAPACLNGTQSPVCLDSPTGARRWMGTGVPSATTVGAARVGDRYDRRDGSAGSDEYACTVAGTPGTWTAIA